ncbi:MAG TPA: PD-(D/E)XK nuclease family protein [Nitrososphaera sp.]|nr:PD-(D/E)XK nuclease family protein [Nitrososphaera sp.]
MTDNSQKAFSDLDAVDAFRVTWLSSMLDCPRRGYAELLGLGKPRISRAAINGTTAHQTIEGKIRTDFALSDADIYNRMIKEGLDKDQAPLVWRYLKTLEPLIPQIHAVEHEFTLQILEGAPFLRGHIDAAFALSPTELLLMDHKTNRNFEGEEIWKYRTQPVCYAAAASFIWPQFHDIWFEVGYVVLDKKVRWKVNLKEARQRMLQTFSEVWAAIKVYRRTGIWPERINEDCGWCPVKDTCSTLKFAHENFMESLVQIDEKPLVERYLHAKHVLASIEAKTNELKQEIIEQLQNNGGKLEHNGMLLYLYNGKRREIEYSAFAGAVAETIRQSPEVANALHDRYYELLDSTLTVKMGMVDALVTDFPALKPAIDAAVTTSASERPTLRVTVKNKK